MRLGVNVLVLVVALLFGGVAAFMVRNWLATHSNGSSAPVQMSTIVVATEPLPFGTQLSADNVAQIEWPSTITPVGSFPTIDALLKGGSRITLSSFVKNEPIVASKIGGPGQRGSLSTMIEPGKRAVTVPVDDVRGVAGFIYPGDFVDVALTRTNGGGGNANAQNFSEVILQHVKVLAIDQTAGERQDHPVVAKAVTVELTSEQALKILLATNSGRLSLILRQSSDRSQGEPNVRVTEHDLFKNGVPDSALPAEAAQSGQPASAEDKAVKPVAETPPPAPAAAPAAPPVKAVETRTVTVVRAMKGDEYEVLRVK